MRYQVEATLLRLQETEARLNAPQARAELAERIARTKMVAAAAAAAREEYLKDVDSSAVETLNKMVSCLSLLSLRCCVVSHLSCDNCW